MNKRRPVAIVTREIAAKPRDVFEAWTNPKHPASPWSKRNGIREVIMKPAVHELFYINMGPPMPLATHFGRFFRLDKPRLIEHAWASEGTLGAETLVRITLKAKGKGTVFTLRHTGLQNEESARGHEEGWGWIIGWLADGFAARKRGAR
ncbi:MAG: SRPBCC domain-containing protein [Thermoplasmata archaeon]